MLRLELPGLAVQQCHGHNCRNQGTDVTFHYLLARKIFGNARYPPSWPLPNDRQDLRSVLKLTYNCGDVEICPFIPCMYTHQFRYAVTEKALRTVCRMADDNAPGLCLICIRDKNFEVQSCEHRHMIQKWVESDPST